MELEMLHVVKGDKKKNLDTLTEKGRKETAVLINKMIREGTAVFLEVGKKAYRVTGYDDKKNRLKVRVESKTRAKEVGVSPDKGRKSAVPPRAGG